MIRQAKFRISARPYAVDLASFKVITRIGETAVGNQVTFDAVWFRRRRGVTVACIGQLREYVSLGADLYSGDVRSAENALMAVDDGRYGGDCLGRWDGRGYWGAESPERAAEHMAILRPMLENFPEIPRGYDGWWVFP